MNNNNVVLLVALVVVGAILLSKYNAAAPTHDVTPSRAYGSRDEVSLTANVIIGELDIEAAESLPTDLRPNMDALSLSEEEEDELFAILNSVADHGVLGVANRLGSSTPMSAAMRAVARKLRIQLSEIVALQKNIGTLKQNVAKEKSPLKKTVYKAKLNKQIELLNSAKAARKATGEKRNLIAKKEAAEKAAVVAKAKNVVLPKPPSSGPEKLNALMKHHQKLVSDYKAFSDYVKHQETFLRKRLNPQQMKSVKNIIADRTRRMASTKKAAKVVHDRIVAEKKRIDAEKKARAIKEQAVKIAREKEELALRLQRDSEEKAAKENARLEKESRDREAKALVTKRLADAARKMVLAKKAREEKIAAANKARLEFEQADAKKKAEALAHKAADLKKHKLVLEEKEQREKMALAAREKSERDRRAAEEVQRKADEKKKKAAVESAMRKAKEIRDRKQREQVQKKLRDAAAREREREELAEKKRVQLAKEEKARVRKKKEKDEAEHKRKLAVIRREEEDIARKRAAEKSRETRRAKEAARMAADKKQREQDRKNEEQRALVLRRKELEIQKKNAEENARARATVEKNEAAIAAKKALVNQRAADSRKARADKRRHEAEAAVKRNGEEKAEIEAGIAKIAGAKSTDRVHFPSLDANILKEIKAFLQSSHDRHPMIPALTRLIESKSKSKPKPKPQEESVVMVEEVFSNIERITGLGRREYTKQAVFTLDMGVLEELLRYLETANLPGKLGQFEGHISGTIFFKKLVVVGLEIGVDVQKARIDRIDFESVDIVGLEKMILFLDSQPVARDHPTMSKISPKLQAIREHKKSVIVAQREEEDRARIQAQNEKLAAIEAARTAQQARDLKESAKKLEQEKKQLAIQLARAEREKAVKKEQLRAEQKKELVVIERKHEKEKRRVAEEASAEMNSVQREIVNDVDDEVANIDAETERKLVQVEQEQARARDQLRLEAIEADATVKAEIAGTQDQAVAKVVQESLEVEKEAREQAWVETQKASVAAREAIVKEAELLKRGVIERGEATLKEERVVIEEKLDEMVDAIESQKQVLVEMKEKVQQIESDQLELESEIETDVLEEEQDHVEEDQATIEAESTVVVLVVETPTVHPRASKKGRVVVSRKTNVNGSSFVKMRVPSDMSPGQFDDVSIFLSKESTGVLEEYQRIHKRLAKGGSFAEVSVEDKRVLASAGAEFKTIREQYVQQRTEQVVTRREKLMAQLI